MSRWCCETGSVAAGDTQLNTDGSFIKETGMAGAGMSLRDETGGTRFSAVRYLEPCCDALEAELSACMEGLALALQHTDRPIHVGTDSSELLALVNGGGRDRSRSLQWPCE